MFDRLAEVQRLLAEEFADSTAGGSRLSDPELVERVEAAQRVANMAFAVQAVRMAQYAAREDVLLEDGTVGQRDRPLGHVSEFAAGVVGPALGLSPAGADAKVRVAARLAGVMRGTLGAVAVGDLDEWRATVLVRELRDASPEVIAAVEEAVLPKAVRETAGQVRNRARRELAKVDPEVLAERVRRCREERGLWRRPGEPGVSEWLAVLPNETSAACWAAVDELARRYRADGDARTLDQARADAMADLVLGNATVTTTLTIAVPVIPDRVGLGLPRSPGERATGDEVPAPGQPSGPTDVDVDVDVDVDTDPERPGGVADPDEAIEIPGVGLVPGHVLAQLAASFGTRAVLALCEWQSGTRATETCEAYRPPRWLRDLVRARDGTCRFFGCTVPATRCDVDHVVPWPHGPTDQTNLACLCRHHHRMKQQPGWQVAMTPDGVLTWTTPLGDSFTTWPVDHLGHPGRNALAAACPGLRAG